MADKRIHVAVGVIIDAEGQVLIARRHHRQHQGGLWEFPGGKVESGEQVEQALARELAEEVNIQVVSCVPLLEISHDYKDKQVLLDVWLVQAFSGQAVGREGQAVEWVRLEDIAKFEFPEANRAIVADLQSRFL